MFTMFTHICFIQSDLWNQRKFFFFFANWRMKICYAQRGLNMLCALSCDVSMCYFCCVLNWWNCNLLLGKLGEKPSWNLCSEHLLKNCKNWWSFYATSCVLFSCWLQCSKNSKMVISIINLNAWFLMYLSAQIFKKHIFVDLVLVCYCCPYNPDAR